MDLCLYGKNNGFSPEAVARGAGIPDERVRAIFPGYRTKTARDAVSALAPPLLVFPVPEIGSLMETPGRWGMTIPTQ